MKPAKAIKKLFKFGKKQAAASKGKGAKAAYDWPSGIRVGLVGHANSGKTVYFTVLNEECKISKDLQISVTDNATSHALLANRRSIWGLGTTSQVGTVVDLQGERAFPEPTTKDLVLVFNAILNGSRNVSVVSYDYPGKAISITSTEEPQDKVRDFMAGCHGLIFFYDPKVMGSELENQAHVASFVSMLESLAPQDRRLPIPIALVINKADVLPGFTGDDQVVLISPEDEHLLSGDFDLFLNRILTSDSIGADSAWAGSVRSVLVKLTDFLRVVVGRTLDFQIFFVSNVGREPEKIGEDVGRSIYKPPTKILPAGVKAPFYWLLNSILRHRFISKFRSVAKTAAILSLIWIALYSLPFLVHFKYLLPRTQLVEQEILRANAGQVFTTSGDERRQIVTAYARYENSKWVKWIFERFKAPSGKIRQFYREFDIGESVKRLDALIGRFNGVVSDSSLWPRYNPSAESLLVSENLAGIVAAFEEFHTGDETTVLYTRSGRILKYWELFTAFIAARGDTAVSGQLIEQVDFDNKTFASDQSGAEKQLGSTLTEKLQSRKEVVTQKEVAKQASIELDDLIAEVNGNNDPEYRLDRAVTRLRRIKGDLDPGADAQAIRTIDRYLREVRDWSRKQTFTYRVETVPENGHLHLEVTGRGESATWSQQTQIFEGDEYNIEWQINDDIHIAFDELRHTCNWGNAPSDKKVLIGKYSLFDLEKGVSFDNIGKQVSISLKPALADRLPKLEK
ncbi:MAG: GTPase domain-containing protein [Candidatus Zixiibacteriota bacterium]|nr:MAG: GTPase domain-containing protein [candidate division Zixibacteria bacterium]